MSRVNPQVEQLEREVRALRQQIETMRRDPGDVPFVGCGDSGCTIAQGPGGQHTNGGCHCDERKMRRACMWWRHRAQFLQATIQGLRAQPHFADAAEEKAERLRRVASLVDSYQRGDDPEGAPSGRRTLTAIAEILHGGF